MRRTVLRSDSVIHGYAYQEEPDRILEIKYRDSGKVFQYVGVEPAVYIFCFEQSFAPGAEWLKHRHHYVSTEAPQ